MQLEQLLTETKTWHLNEFYDKSDLQLYLDKIMGHSYKPQAAFIFLEGQVSADYKIFQRLKLISSYIPIYAKLAYDLGEP